MILLYCYEYVLRERKTICIESLHDMTFVERNFYAFYQGVCRKMKSLACKESVIVEVWFDSIWHALYDRHVCRKILLIPSIGIYDCDWFCSDDFWSSTVETIFLAWCFVVWKTKVSILSFVCKRSIDRSIVFLLVVLCTISYKHLIITCFL